MSAILLFFKGWIIGLFIAAPVGPVGVLCIRRTLNHGWISGLCAGFGAAIADTIYGAVAVFGIVLVSDFLFDHQFALKLAGGVFLTALGFKMMIGRKKTKETGNNSDELAKASHLIGISFTPISDMITTFLITMTNPGTIIAFFAIFAMLGMTSYGSQPILAGVVISGVFFGALSWWGGLSWGVSRFQVHIGDHMHHKINRVSGIVMLVFGLLAFASLGYHVNGGHGAGDDHATTGQKLSLKTVNEFDHAGF